MRDAGFLGQGGSIAPPAPSASPAWAPGSLCACVGGAPAPCGGGGEGAAALGFAVFILNSTKPDFSLIYVMALVVLFMMFSWGWRIWLRHWERCIQVLF